MLPERHRFARTARSIARRNAGINLVRISLVRMLREEKLARRMAAQIRALKSEIDGIVEQNANWEDLRDELLQTFTSTHSVDLPIPENLSQSSLSVWLLVNLGLTAEEIANVLFLTKRSVETVKYRMGKDNQ